MTMRYKRVGFPSLDGKAELEAHSKDGDIAEGVLPPVEHLTFHQSFQPILTNPTLAALNRSANSPVSPNSVNSPPILLNTIFCRTCKSKVHRS
jgi:hypothetical protein